MAGLATRGAKTGSAWPFSVSHRPSDDAGWVELLAGGLTFDLSGLAPAVPAPAAPQRHRFALGEAELGLEAVSLVPGAHLAGGEALLPIVRMMTGLAVTLASLPGVVAVAWHPARSWIERQYFIRVAVSWLGGGAFPALGLTALVRDPGGLLRSEGLSFFTGQEIAIAAPAEDDPGDVAKLGIRLIHRLVEVGTIREETEFPTDDGGSVRVVPGRDHRTLHVLRR